MDTDRRVAQAVLDRVFQTERELSSFFEENFLAIDDVVKCFGEMFVPEDFPHLESFDFPEPLDDQPRDSFLILPSPTFLCHHLLTVRKKLVDLQNLDTRDERLLRITGGRPGWVMLRKSNLARQSRRNGFYPPPGEEFSVTSTVVFAAMLYRLVRGRDLFKEPVYAVHPSAMVSTSGGRIILRSAIGLENGTPLASEIIVSS
jgi:hypothetical protein